MSSYGKQYNISNVEVAAVEAALEDGLITQNGVYNSEELARSRKAGLRRGKWTTEEENYANRLIYEFKLGLLPLTDGTTLRTFLSKLLNCDPMRISKKFVGSNCIGKVRSGHISVLRPWVFNFFYFQMFLSYVIHSKYSGEDSRI